MTFAKSALAAAVVVLTSAPALADDISGRARAISGDTLEIGDFRIRLFGIDAPETKQRCSASGVRYNCADQSKAALAHLTRDGDVRCRVENYDPSGQVVAVCFVGNLDINREMVRLGWALAYRQYSKTYIQDEADAEHRKAGLWMGEFKNPWDWRRENP